MAGLDATNASVWERELVELLARHAEEESEFLEGYRRFSEDAESPAVRYLVRLIMEDEERHHRVMAELANSVAWGPTSTDDSQAVPDLPVRPGNNRELIEKTKQFLYAERRDHEELRDLRRKLNDVAETTLWALLVDTMLLDTEKHIKILRFILATATQR